MDHCAGDILRSTDGGTSWTLVADDPVDNNVWDVHFINSTTGWVSGKNGVLARTDDGGRTWVDQDPLTKSNLRAIYFADEQRGWIGGDAFLLTTSDGGTTWNKVPTPTQQGCRIFGLEVRLPSIWAVGDCGNVYFSADRGGTWKDRSLDSDAILWAVEFVDDERGWVVGEAVGTGRPVLMETVNGGRTWGEALVLPETSGAPRDISVLETPDGLVGWAVGDGGLLLRLLSD